VNRKGKKGKERGGKEKKRMRGTKEKKHPGFRCKYGLHNEAITTEIMSIKNTLQERPRRWIAYGSLKSHKSKRILQIHCSKDKLTWLF
jgi:hypothetical protein